MAPAIMGGLNLQRLFDQDREHAMLETEAFRRPIGHRPPCDLTRQTRFPGSSLAPDEQACESFVKGRLQLRWGQVGHRLPIEEDWDSDVHRPMADRGLSLKFRSSGREVLGHPGIKHPAAVMEEPHEENIAEGNFDPPKLRGQGKICIRLEGLIEPVEPEWAEPI
jgi:hypothetical protein